MGLDSTLNKILGHASDCFNFEIFTKGTHFEVKIVGKPSTAPQMKPASFVENRLRIILLPSFTCQFRSNHVKF